MHVEPEEACRLAGVHDLEGPRLLEPVVENLTPALDPEGEGEHSVEQRYPDDPEVHDARATGGVDLHADDRGVGANHRVVPAVADLEENTTSSVGYNASDCAHRIVRSSPVRMYGTVLSPE